MRTKSLILLIVAGLATTAAVADAQMKPAAVSRATLAPQLRPVVPINPAAERYVAWGMAVGGVLGLAYGLTVEDEWGRMGPIAVGFYTLVGLGWGIVAGLITWWGMNRSR